MYQCNTPNNLKTNVISLFLKNIISSDLEKANLIRFLNFVYKPHVFYLYFLFLRLCMCSWFYNKTHHLLNWGHDTSKVRITRNNTQPMIHAPKENRNCWRVYLCMTRESILLTDRLLFCSLFFCSFPKEQRAFNLFCQWPCKTNAKSTYTNKQDPLLKNKHTYRHTQR